MRSSKRIVALLAAIAAVSPLAVNSSFADMVIPGGGATTVIDGGAVVVAPAGWWADMGEFFGNGRAYIAPILLPTLPAGMSFGDADLMFKHHGPGTHPDALRTGFFGGLAPDYNIDLYGLPRVAALADVLDTDHFSGPADTAATLLQDAYMDPLSPGNREEIHTTAGGDSALTAWLNLMYDNGNNAGKYVFIRLNPDGVEGTLPWSGYQVMTDFAGGADEKPALTYSVVPEPATLALIVLGGAMVLRRRR